MRAERVLGVDLGGTQCRALLADTEGARYGAGHAQGGHPGSDPAAALAGVAGAVADALEGTLPSMVRGVVLGAAGHAAVAEPTTAQALAQVWTAAGLRCPVRVRPDCEVAFAAGTPDPNGIVLVAGTGSMAARIADHSIAARTGGHGWVLGDEGSGFWLGREAVRATLRMLERGRPAGELVCRVLATVLGGVPPDSDPLRTIGKVTTWVHRKAPVGVAALAPLVCAAARIGDAEAGALLERAAGLLTDLALALWRTGEPVVLAGGLLTAGPLGALVSDRLRATGARVHHSGDTAAGAAWLATLDLRTPRSWTGDRAKAYVRLMGASQNQSLQNQSSQNQSLQNQSLQGQERSTGRSPG
ncbi:MAG: N-acetylglucosamine kinase [Pseudonocardiaceae bacterium]